MIDKLIIYVFLKKLCWWERERKEFFPIQYFLKIFGSDSNEAFKVGICVIGHNSFIYEAKQHRWI